MLPTLYLVRVRHGLDDIPVFISDDENEAIEFAQETSFFPSHEVLMAVGCPIAYSPCAIDLVKFVDGYPVETTAIRDFDNEMEVGPPSA